MGTRKGFRRSLEPPEATQLVGERRDKNELGLTEAARQQLDVIRAEAGFKDMQDLYRLAISVALLKSLEPAPVGLQRVTYVNIGGLDRDQAIRTAILAVRDDHEDRPYALAERLAEAGIEDIHGHFASGRPIREYLQGLQPS